MGVPFGLILIVLSFVSLLWGIGCAVVGGMLRFNLAQYVNDYISGLDVGFINKVSRGMVTIKGSYDEVDLGDSTQTIGIMAIVIGVLVIAYSLVGLVAGLLKHISVLFMLIGCVLVTTMLEFVVLWMMMDANSSFHDSAKTAMATRIASDYELGKDANTFSQIMNSIMLAGECCGSSGPQDFNNITYAYTSGMVQLMLVSPACCKHAVWERDFDALIECGINRNSDHHTDGCYDTLFSDASDGTMGTYLILVILIILWQCFAMGVGVMMLFHPKDDDKKAVAKPTTAADEAAAAEAEMKTFTPFSKLSSFPHSDINRIKSTEIW